MPFSIRKKEKDSRKTQSVHRKLHREQPMRGPWTKKRDYEKMKIDLSKTRKAQPRSMTGRALLQAEGNLPRKFTMRAEASKNEMRRRKEGHSSKLQGGAWPRASTREKERPRNGGRQEGEKERKKKKEGQNIIAQYKSTRVFRPKQAKGQEGKKEKMKEEGRGGFLAQGGTQQRK